jgi:hypothetical protein
MHNPVPTDEQQFVAEEPEQLPTEQHLLSQPVLKVQERSFGTESYFQLQFAEVSAIIWGIGEALLAKLLFIFLKSYAFFVKIQDNLYFTDLFLLEY